MLNECLRILIDCSQLSKTYYMLFGFHLRSSCPTHISADVCGGRKSLVKPVTRQNISSCSVLSSEIVMHDDAYIGGCSENNIKCVVHDDLRWKNRTTRYILPHHWLYEWFSQFHRCGTYAVLSRSPSTECKVMINTDTGRQRPRPLHVHYPQSPFPSASLSNVYWLADPKPMFYVYGWRY